MNHMEKQYEMLREEIMAYQGMSLNTLTVTYVAVGAILSYVFLNLDALNTHFELPLLFIPIFVFLVIIFMRLRIMHESILSISAYMQIFLEPNLEGISWETYLCSKPGRYSVLLKNYTPNLFFMLGIYALFIYVLITNFGSISLMSLAIAGVSNSIMCAISIWLVVGGYQKKRMDKHKEQWRTVNLEFHPTTTPKNKGTKPKPPRRKQT